MVGYFKNIAVSISPGISHLQAFGQVLRSFLHSTFSMAVSNTFVKDIWRFVTWAAELHGICVSSRLARDYVAPHWS